MRRERHLEFCGVCKNQQFDPNKGIVCGLTNEIANFEGTCIDYLEDPQLKSEYDAGKIKRETTLLTASLNKRFVNYLFDSLFIFIFTFIVVFRVLFMLMAFFPSGVNFNLGNYGGYLVTYTFSIVFYTVFETSTGKSPGKYITKTKVVTLTGEKPDFISILKRSLCRCIPFNAVSFLFTDNSFWHDSLSKTMVIEDKSID